MKLEALRRKVNQRSGAPVGTAFVTDAINEALAELSAEERWPWLEGVEQYVVGDDAVALAVPVDAATVVSVVLGGVPFQPVSRAEFATWDRSLGPVWTTNGAVLAVAPLRTGMAVTVNYVRREDELIQAADEPLLPDAYVAPLIDRACAIVLGRMDDQKRADDFDGRYRAWIPRMRRSALQAHRGPHRVRAREDGI